MVEGTTRITIDTPIVFNDPLPEKTDVVVIGGGIIGVFSALYLAEMGRSVLLCEKGRIAGEQSSRNWGWIRQHGRDAAELPIMMQALQLWHETDARTGGQCGVKTGGSYYLASSQQSLNEYEEWLPVAQDHGLESRLFSAKEVSDLCNPNGTYPWVGATGTSSDARGEPWRAVPAVAALAHDAGVSIRENCAVRGLLKAGDQITGVVTEHGSVSCEQIVLAGGAWSSLFARRHGIDIPQLSVRSTVAQTEPMPDFANGNFADEHLAFRRRDDGGFTLALSDHIGFYPGPDAMRHVLTYLPLLRENWKELGIHLKGSHGYPDGWRTPRRWEDEEVTPFEHTRVLEAPANDAKVATMIQRFAERFPEIGRPKILESWAGMVDTMPDVVPIVDRVPEIENLVIATGMSGHGFGIGPGFGRVVARMITGQQPEHDLSRFRFSRFTDGSVLEVGGAL